MVRIDEGMLTSVNGQKESPVRLRIAENYIPGEGSPIRNFDALLPLPQRISEVSYSAQYFERGSGKVCILLCRSGIRTDGLSEEVVAGLSRFSYLRVITHGSMQQYANHAPIGEWWVGNWAPGSVSQYNSSDLVS